MIKARNKGNLAATAAELLIRSYISWFCRPGVFLMSIGNNFSEKNRPRQEY